jgi:hypothetical protein
MATQRADRAALGLPLLRMTLQRAALSVPGGGRTGWVADKAACGAALGAAGGRGCRLLTPRTGSTAFSAAGSSS